MRSHPTFIRALFNSPTSPSYFKIGVGQQPAAALPDQKVSNELKDIDLL